MGFRHNIQEDQDMTGSMTDAQVIGAIRDVDELAWNAAIDAAADLIVRCQPVYSGDGTRRMRPRMDGNLDGLPYVDAIRRLKR